MGAEDRHGLLRRVGRVAAALALTLGALALLALFVWPGRGQLLCYVAGRGNVTATKLLLGIGANPNWQHPYLYGSSLHYAARNGQTAVAQVLLDRGANPNAQDQHGETALHIAAMNGDIPLAKSLLGHGADPNVVDKDWQSSPLVFAVARSKWEVAKLLLARGADPNILGAGGSALDNAMDNPEMRRLLLAHGARHAPPDRPPPRPARMRR